MIKINLLPAQVFEKQVVRRLIGLFGVVLVLIVVGSLALRMKANADLGAMQTKLTETQAIEAQVRQLEKQRSDELAKVGPIETKVKFIEDVMDYNTKAPALYEELARFTYEKIKYRTIELTDTEMKISAYAPSIADAGRYLLNLYRASHIFSQVSMSSVPGYSSKESGGMMSPESMAQLAQNLQGNPKLAAAMKKKMSSAQSPGAAMKILLQATGGSGLNRPRGFDFTVTCKLTNPFAPPSYGGAGGAASTGGSSSGGTSYSSSPATSPRSYSPGGGSGGASGSQLMNPGGSGPGGG
jgi:hypothetical protein